MVHIYNEILLSHKKKEILRGWRVAGLGEKGDGIKKNNKQPNKKPHKHSQRYGDEQRESRAWGGRRGCRGINGDGRRLTLAW